MYCKYVFITLLQHYCFLCNRCFVDCFRSSKSAGAEGYEKAELPHGDRIFHRFMKRVSRVPQQILRCSSAATNSSRHFVCNYYAKISYLWYILTGVYCLVHFWGHVFACWLAGISMVVSRCYSNSVQMTSYRRVNTAAAQECLNYNWCHHWSTIWKPTY